MAATLVDFYINVVAIAVSLYFFILGAVNYAKSKFISLTWRIKVQGGS